MTAPLKPCPFCGGNSKRHTLPSDEFGNEGGDVIECTQCGASSCVEFGRKENLVSKWNTRASSPELLALVSALRVARRTILEGGCGGVTCTVWVPDDVCPSETLVDHLDAELAKWEALQ